MAPPVCFLEMQNLNLPLKVDQNLHFNMILRGFMCMLKSEKHLSGGNW